MIRLIDEQAMTRLMNFNCYWLCLCT